MKKNNYIEFFIENNKSGNKTKEIYLKKNYIELHNKIINHCNNELKDLPFKEKVWCFINNIKEKPKCKNCNKVLKFKRSLKEGYGVYCSIKCANTCEDRKVDIINTNFNKFGSKSPLTNNIIKNKSKKTLKEKYGVDNIFKNTEYIKEKTIKKHNVEHISKLNKVKEKRKKTNLEKYNVSTPLKLDRVKNRRNKLKYCNFEKKYNDYDFINNIGNELIIKCKKCNENYNIDRTLFRYRVENNVNPCTKCNRIGNMKSIKEKELVEFIDSLNIDYILNDRNILNGKELDIYIPSYNLAIEFNGLYYHSELFTNKNYHINKTKVCKEKDINLIHIFEDEWIYKKDIVKSRLNNILKLNKNKIYARKCVIKEVKTKEKTIFLNKNHIQGAVGSSINLGLYYNDNLVSIMTFGKGRRITNSSEKEWELLRFCNILNTSVIGSASKLFKYFVKKYNPNEIISYADYRWSNGNLYELLGFNLKHLSKPNYWYVLRNKREYRFKYRKSELVKQGYDKNKSESEIMFERKIYKIYDCGNLSYKKTFQN